MVKSMTAYGHSSSVSSLGQWQVEVHSVNKKSLECAIYLPKELLRFEIEMRKKMSSFCKRGQVTARVSFFPSASTLLSSQQIIYLQGMRKKMEEVCLEIGCEKEQITFPFLYEKMRESVGPRLQVEDDLLEKELFACLEAALLQYVERKEAEGAFLKKALLEHLQILESLLEKLKEQVEKITEKRRQKILTRLGEFQQVKEEDQERLFREVFYYVERADVTEEIVRLFSHIDQCKGVLEEEGSIGRSLDFLVQEMGREINTVSSKSDDVDITRITLKMKVEVEKIREQVQNVE